MALAKWVRSRYERLKGERFNFDTLFQDVGDYIVPRKSNITTVRSPGEKQTRKLFDSTAIQANQLLASTLQSTLTSPTVKWFDLVTTNPDLMRDDSTRFWLQAVRDEIFSAFQASNLEAELNEAYMDLGSFGTSAIMVGEKPMERPGFNGLIYQSLAINEYVIDENSEGLVDQAYRKFQMTPHKMMEKWGMENLPLKARELLEKRPDDDVTVYHAVFPRSRRVPGRIDAGNKPFASVWVMDEGDTILREGGFDFFPFIVSRWQKTSGERYGRSPGSIALPDVRTLNQAKMMELKAWTKVIDPPIITDDENAAATGVLTRPSSINVVSPGRSIRPLDTSGNFQVALLKTGELQDSIRKAFFADRLVLPPFQGQAMTAFEVEQRLQEMNRILGPTMGRLKSELLRPLIKTAFLLMFRAGSFDAPPPALQRVLAQRRGPALEIDFRGPLARAQMLGEAAAVRSWVAETVIPLAQVNPEVLDRVDLDSVVELTGERLSIPRDVVRSDEEVELIRGQRAEAAAAQAQAQATLQTSQALKNSAPFIEATKPEGAF